MTRWIFIFGCVFCVVLIGGGFASLERYTNTPGREAAAPSRLPQLAALPLSSDKPQLLMFVHPRCPCTRASLEELARVLAQSPRPADVRVLFTVPANAGDAWRRGGLWDQAAAIPGVQTQTDAGGALAKRFGAVTSGQVLLYAPDGRLLFRGGITGTRGHEGDNPGSDAVLDRLTDSSLPCRRNPVFGCALAFDPS